MSRNRRTHSPAPPDISAQVLRDVLDHCSDGVCVAVPEPWRLVYANDTLLSWLGAGSHEWRERPLADIFPLVASEQVLQQLDRVLRGDADEVALAERLAPTDGPTLAEIRLRRVVVGDQPAVAIIARQAAASPPPVSDVDSLTGLPGRTFLFSRLEELLHGGRAADRRFAVLFIDLNEFKWVNDTYGHLVGDRALCEVARRLATCVRAGDHIARFGGDEFVVLLKQVHSEVEIRPVLDRIHAVLEPPITLPAGAVTLTASIGVAEASPAYQTAEDLFAAADLAMYASKRR